MRVRALSVGVIVLLGLAGRAAAQFSTTMNTTMTGATTASNGSSKSSYFTQLLGSRASVPSFNILNMFPSAPKTYGTMLGRTPTGTMPQAIIISSPAQGRMTGSGFFRRNQGNSTTPPPSP